MCFSAQVSITTFILGLATSAMVFSLGGSDNKIVGSFFGFAILMQLLEYLLWMHQTCDDYNRLLSLGGMVLNHLQPVVLGLLILCFNESANARLVWSLMAVYSIVIVAYSSQFVREKQCTLKNKENHLYWKWNTMDFSTAVYLLFLGTFFLLLKNGLKNKRDGNMLAWISVGSFALSTLIYGDSRVVGALWCFMAVLIPAFWYAVNRLR